MGLAQLYVTLIEILTSIWAQLGSERLCQSELYKLESMESATLANSMESATLASPSTRLPADNPQSELAAVNQVSLQIIDHRAFIVK